MSQFSSPLMTRYDLHCHTQASDGDLSPIEVVERAIEMGVNVLSITDHDTCEGVIEAREYLSHAQRPLTLINGVEISTLWENIEIHIVGLNFSPTASAMVELLERQSVLRVERGKEIGRRLQKAGIADAWENALEIAQGGQVTRAHFAQYLVKTGKEKTISNVFKRYLSKGKTGYVSAKWCTIDEAVKVIQQAGGVAVLAHPSKYQLSNKWLKRLIAYFKQCQGDAMEVSHCQQPANEKQYLDELAQSANLKTSMGSDFHRPCSWIELGRNLWLPDDQRAVWTLWDEVKTT
ncbi:TPA: PHP domain-containing protein [Providencia stuartii]|uniref:RNase RNM n=1 Tax=Providencia stuartii TaxID=588 RepID=UPI00053656E3|nr:PHP domain-containing protein [Providencia stuartii]AXO17413.1 PHP domain-containing protein [Providencia stuartii]MBN5591459.1 PHP domain-containing protein [Providencia stuartii]HEM6907151.1 PHP domain-containing protein [Providencia stuartii]HEM7154502.1 PHP domain-containing protein [Providencia stuartii]HEM7522872.1 PHP domain-containing protein [Providencia stuartii]